jgi:hypothetical protein
MYIVDQIFSDKQIDQLGKLYDTIEGKFAHQDYNLFDVEKRDIERKDWDNPLLQTLTDYSKLKPISFYFLKYTKDSFTKIHTDNGSDMTIITIISTINLVGGETICLDKYTKNKRPKEHYAKRGMGKGAPKSAPTGQDIIPKIIRVKDGQSVVHGPKMHHGVSQVEKGSRIVLISWFSTAGKNPNE